MRDNVRPCGACRALVPGDTGCEHWRPTGRHATTAAETRTQRNARYRVQARERARQDVAAFRGAMGYPEPS